MNNYKIKFIFYFKNFNNLRKMSVLTKSHMNPGKTQYYGVDGTGRDTYIFNINGGFAPEKQPTTIEGIGKFIFNSIFNFFIDHRFIRYNKS